MKNKWNNTCIDGPLIVINLSCKFYKVPYKYEYSIVFSCPICFCNANYKYESCMRTGFLLCHCFHCLIKMSNATHFRRTKEKPTTCWNCASLSKAWRYGYKLSHPNDTVANNAVCQPGMNYEGFVGFYVDNQGHNPEAKQGHTWTSRHWTDHNRVRQENQNNQ